MTSHIRTGQQGEDAAEQFLIQKGYRIVERNFRNKIGEMDVIAIDGDVLCFVEVKTRYSDHRGSPFESITLAKQRKLAKVALSYIQTNKLYDTQARFDVVSVIKHSEGSDEIELIENAFDLSDGPYR